MLEILIASFNGSFIRNNFKIDFENYPPLVINQYNTEKGKLESTGFTKVINSTKLGLSKSRNLAIKNSQGDAIWIVDDDVHFRETVIKELEKEIYQLFAAGYMFVTVNNYDSTGPKFAEFKHTKFSIMKIPSWCIILNGKVREIDVRFDDKFGINALYGSGEENIFLYDLLSMGYDGYHLDAAPICHSDVSTGFKWDAHLCKTKGAVFRRTYGGIFGLIILILFMLKKMPHYNFNFRFLIMSISSYVRFHK